MTKDADIEDTFSRLLGWSVALSGTRLEPVPYWSVRVHADAKFTADELRAWWRAAVEQAALADAIPAVIFRRSGTEGWKVLVAGWGLDAPRPADWDRFEFACEFRPAAWALIAKDVAQTPWRYSAAISDETFVRTIGH